MQFPVFIRLHRSSFLARAGVGIYLLGALFVAVTPLPLWGKIALLASVALFGLLSWKQYQTCLKWLNFNLVLNLPEASLPDASNCGLGYFASDEQSELCPLELLSGSVLHPWLTVLPLRLEGKTHTLILLPDSIKAEDFRRLRVFLGTLARR